MNDNAFKFIVAAFLAVLCSKAVESDIASMLYALCASLCSFFAVLHAFMWREKP